MALSLQLLFSLLIYNRSLFAQPSVAAKLRELDYPAAADFRATSPFRICDKELVSFQAAQNESPRLSYLNAVKREFKKRFPLDHAEINNAFEPVLRTAPDKAEHQTKLEELTVQLNRLEFKKSKLSERINTLKDNFNRFNSPVKREPKSIDKNDECIEKPSPQFLDYALIVRDTINKFFPSYDFGAALVKTLEKTPLLPSGTRVFFGATTNHTNGATTICLNPEEETTLLIPKVMHELVHAGNSEVAALAVLYDKSKDKWQKSKFAFTAAEADLVLFDDQVNKDSEMDSENLRDMVSELESPSEAVVRSLLVKTAVNKKPYLRLSMESGIEQQSKLLMQWKSSLAQVEIDKREAVSDRTTLDIARFYDEHGAYSVSLKSAWALVREDPGYFCRVWVPSYQEKRPVRFFQAFEKLESQIYEKTFSAWLANEYSFVASNYLKTSLYQDGDKSSGLKPALEKRAQEILRQEFHVQ